MYIYTCWHQLAIYIYIWRDPGYSALDGKCCLHIYAEDKCDFCTVMNIYIHYIYIITDAFAQGQKDQIVAHGRYPALALGCACTRGRASDMFICIYIYILWANGNYLRCSYKLKPRRYMYIYIHIYIYVYIYNIYIYRWLVKPAYMYAYNI